MEHEDVPFGSLLLKGTEGCGGAIGYCFCHALFYVYLSFIQFYQPSGIVVMEQADLRRESASSLTKRPVIANVA